MSKIDQYRQELARLPDWEPYLLAESGLPGPRGNIELARAVAAEGDKAFFRHCLSYDAEKAPVNSPYEFLAFCGVLGLGRLLSEGDDGALPAIRRAANDPRWRLREAAAMALQSWGRDDMAALLAEMKRWTTGTLLEGRAAAAAICEPDLLRDDRFAEPVFHILDAVTTALANTHNRKEESFKTLRKGLAYCWSVAIAAFPDAGRPRMAAWFNSDDKDIRWVMRENLKKKRLQRLDPEWIAAAREALEG